MDNLTHGLTGLMLSRVGLNRLCPRASAILVIAAEVPDIDVVSMFAGRDVYLDYHRGITHSVLFAPVMAFLPLLLAGLWRRRGDFRWGWGYGLSLIGILSHLALDWTNVYGIRLLSPMAQTWFRGDITHIVDPWIWAALLLGVGWPLLSRLVTSEIGARPTKGAGIAAFALVFLLFYEGARWTLHQRAIDSLNSHTYDQRIPRRALATPHMVNPWRWTGLLEFDNAWQAHDMDLLREFDPMGGQILYQAPPSPAMETARRTYTFQSFLRFSQAPLWEAGQLPEPEGAVQVTVRDLRFGPLSERRFRATAIFSPTGALERSWFAF